jgi:hypothetical protein
MSEVDATAPAHRRSAETRWWLLAGALLVVAGTLLVAGWRGHSVALDAPTISVTTTPPARPYSVGRSVPVRLVIPAIGVRTKLVKLGLNPDGTVEVPTTWGVAGWYHLGPSPGQIGSAVILGHVDSYLGPAIFYRLRELRPGDHVLVTLADGVHLRFSVVAIAMYSKSHFPTQLVYGPRRYSALELVTCGGAFDEATHHYLSNVVVSTTLTRPRAPATA